MLLMSTELLFLLGFLFLFLFFHLKKFWRQTYKNFQAFISLWLQLLCGITLTFQNVSVIPHKSCNHRSLHLLLQSLELLCDTIWVFLHDLNDFAREHMHLTDVPPGQPSSPGPGWVLGQDPSHHDGGNGGELGSSFPGKGNVCIWKEILEFGRKLRLFKHTWIHCVKFGGLLARKYFFFQAVHLCTDHCTDSSMNVIFRL